MSFPVLILGESGSGKSSSLRNFERGEAIVVQTLKKPLPFKSDIRRAATRDFNGIRACVDANEPEDVLVLDDFGYVITDTYVRMSYGSEKVRDQFEIYKKIGAEVYNLINHLMEDGRDNRIVYIMMHIDHDSYGNIEPATIGKLLNEKIKLVGMFTIALMSTCEGESYQFVTNGKPFKSPPDMFELAIDNDLKAVDATIRKYYGMEPLKKADV